MHALLDPIVGVLLIASPFLFGFSDQGAPTAVAIVVGLIVLLVGMSTAWRLSLVDVIPLLAHAFIDVLVAVALIASPFLFGFSDEGTPTGLFIGLGVADLLFTLGTRWRPAPGAPTGRPRRSTSRRPPPGAQPTA